VHVSRSLLFFPCTNVPYVNIHTEHISIYPVMSATETITKLFPHCSHLTNIHPTVSPAVSVATRQSLCSQKNSQGYTCFHALRRTTFRKAVILLLRSAVLSRLIGSCGTVKGCRTVHFVLCSVSSIRSSNTVAVNSAAV